MAPTDPNDAHDGDEPSHFDVLSLSPQSLDGQDATAQADAIKHAYRRALLKHHPDKQQAQSSSADNSSPSPARTQQHFTVDQITEAYNVLSDAQQRRRYTRTLYRQQQQQQSSANPRTTRRRRKQQQASVETVDLDDLSWSGKRRLYYRACEECGKSRGFGLREDEIDDDEDEDVEIVVECSGQGCDAELRVLVPALVDDDDDDDESDGAGGGGFYGGGMAAAGQRMPMPFQTPMPPPPQWNYPAAAANTANTANNYTPPPKKKKGWGLRLGLGLSLGGGASVGGGRSR